MCEVIGYSRMQCGTDCICRCMDAGAGRDWGDWVGENNADDAVPGRGGLHIKRQDWMHTAASCRGHECCQARC